MIIWYRDDAIGYLKRSQGKTPKKTNDCGVHRLSADRRHDVTCCISESNSAWPLDDTSGTLEHLAPLLVLRSSEVRDASKSFEPPVETAGCSRDGAKLIDLFPSPSPELVMRTTWPREDDRSTDVRAADDDEAKRPKGPEAMGLSLVSPSLKGTTRTKRPRETDRSTECRGDNTALRPGEARRAILKPNCSNTASASPDCKACTEGIRPPEPMELVKEWFFATTQEGSAPDSELLSAVCPEFARKPLRGLDGSASVDPQALVDPETAKSDRPELARCPNAGGGCGGAFGTKITRGFGFASAARDSSADASADTIPLSTSLPLHACKMAGRSSKNALTTAACTSSAKPREAPPHMGQLCCGTGSSPEAPLEHPNDGSSVSLRSADVIGGTSNGEPVVWRR
mmetsp:Transcript_60471/g.174450  ORF Transcript_60471/g.174450 Transcript_60471/m.174450 type:complete len:399 (+) Transcript_60471:1206-2402(+)